MYGKFFSSTFIGSMMGAGPTVFAVWGYIVANTVKSTIELNPALLSTIIGCPITDIEKAIEYLSLPDTKSRSGENEGRRIVRQGQFQYFVTNYQLYHNMRCEDDRREYNRLKQAEHRAKKKLDVKQIPIAVKPSVKCQPQLSTLSAKEEEEEEEDTDTDTDTEECNIPSNSKEQGNSKVSFTDIQKNNSINSGDGSVTPPPLLPGIKPDKPKHRGRPKASTGNTTQDAQPKPKPPAAGAIYPALISPDAPDLDPNKLVSAWAVWIDMLRDFGLPDPIQDNRDTQVSKALSPTIRSRRDLESIYSQYIQDEGVDQDTGEVIDKFLNGLGRAKPLRFLTQHISKYQQHLAYVKQPGMNYIESPWNYGSWKASKDKDRQDLISAGVNPDALPAGSDPGEAILKALESQA